ncbi:hypothetical protein C8R43DRAFT_1127006 [Mycena crocata]|nr:hypothetical protein C8R43DRAFT_1127006 [Mycena crocata]
MVRTCTISFAITHQFVLAAQRFRFAKLSSTAWSIDAVRELRNAHSTIVSEALAHPQDPQPISGSVHPTPNAFLQLVGALMLQLENEVVVQAEAEFEWRRRFFEQALWTPEDALTRWMRSFDTPCTIFSSRTMHILSSLPFKL